MHPDILLREIAIMAVGVSSDMTALQVTVQVLYQ